MRKKKQAAAGSVVKDQLRKGAGSAQEVLQSPVLNILADLHFASAEVPSSKQERDAFIVERRCKALCSTQLNIPPGVSSISPEGKAKAVVKEPPECQAVQRLCDAIDAEVKSRSDAIRALTAAQYASFKVQLDLQLSKFSTEEQNMPLEDYLKTCPGIKSMTSADGRIQLQKRSSPYPKLEESKRNLQDLLTKVKDGTSKLTNSLLFTPCPGPTATQFCTSEREQQEPEQKPVGEELSWPEYYMRLQSLGFNPGLAPSVGSHNNMNTPMTFKGGFMSGLTPKTLRLPKHGETMLSINGSPLGQFGKTPASAAGTRITRSSRLALSSKRSMRDL